MLRSLAVAALMGAPLTANAQTLTGAEWQVSALAGGALPEGVVPVLVFAEGRVSGQAGCNRFMGGYAQDGLALAFTAMAGTKMACDPDRMAVERRMFDALGGVTTLALTPGGALELLDAGGALLIRATR